jgi:Skp family chaperone for outer membrane proteins
VAKHAAIPAPPPQQPDAARLPLASFFSSITSVFTIASTPKPDTLNPDAVAQPEPPPKGDNGARKWRRHAEAKRQQRRAEAKQRRAEAKQRRAEAKRQQRHAEAKRQQRHAEAKRQQRRAEAKRQQPADAKPEPPPEAKAKPGGVSLDKADSDALFREYFGRK